MKKKVLLIILSLVCALTFAFGLMACDNSQAPSEPPKEPVSYTITFETNGGTPIDPITVDVSRRLKTLLEGKTTEKQDKVFDGWYEDASFNVKADLDEFVDGDVKLYAKWRDYTDVEILENAVKNTRINAVVAHDSGMVRLSATRYSTVDVTVALKNGVITAGSDGSRYYKDESFYYTSSNEKVKLKEKEAETVTEFLYSNVIGTVDYKKHGFYSTFAPLSMFRLADESSLCSFERNVDVFTVTYKGSSSGIKHNWEKESNPWVYFDAGKIFKFTVLDNKVVKVEQIQITQAYRTIEFFYDGDENIPSVAEPQNESSYTQKWQVKGNGAGLLVTQLNKAQLDERAYSGCAQITKNQTWYYDKEMKNAVEFDENGMIEINQHYDLYHPEVDYSAIVVDEFKIAPKYSDSLKLVGTSTENGIKITTFKRTDALTSGNVEIKVEPDPWRANDKEFTAELVDIPDDGLLNLRNYVGGKTIEVVKSISDEYVIKVTATVGGYVEYIRIQPMS